MNHDELNPAAYVVLEGLTSISALLSAKKDRLNDRPIYRILFDRTKKSKKFREYHFLESQSELIGFNLIEAEPDEINAYATGNTHGGVIALCGDRTVPELSTEQIRADGFYVMLEGIEDPYNFGYALRSLYAAGVDGIVLSPRNWMSAAGTVARASAGTSELFPMSIASPDTACDIFRQARYTILSAGIRNSVSVFEETFKKPIFLIVGGEKRGISSSVLAKSDKIVRIDYGRSFRGSLSAASAASVLAFEILRQNK